MKISCDLVQDLLPLYFDGVCSQESVQAVEAHLKDCEKCRTDISLMKQNIKTGTVHEEDRKIAKAAAAAWNKGKKRAFINGSLIALLIITVLIAGYYSFHWFSTADESDLGALAKQAADYFEYDEVSIVKVEQRGNYLAALCKDTNGKRSMCVFVRDRLFENRWRANGGKPEISDGIINSWNYGSPQNEAVLIFCGGDIPEEICWYKFESRNITYTCPIENENLLDIFIIADSSDINAYPIFLDCNQQEIE